MNKYYPYEEIRTLLTSGSSEDEMKAYNLVKEFGWSESGSISGNVNFWVAAKGNDVEGKWAQLFAETLKNKGCGYIEKLNSDHPFFSIAYIHGNQSQPSEWIKLSAEILDDNNIKSAILFSIDACSVEGLMAIDRVVEKRKINIYSDDDTYKKYTVRSLFGADKDVMRHMIEKSIINNILNVKEIEQMIRNSRRAEQTAMTIPAASSNKNDEINTALDNFYNIYGKINMEKLVSDKSDEYTANKKLNKII